MVPVFETDLEVPLGILHETISCFRLSQMVVKYNKTLHSLLVGSFKLLFPEIQSLRVSHTPFRQVSESRVVDLDAFLVMLHKLSQREQGLEDRLGDVVILDGTVYFFDYYFLLPVIEHFPATRKCQVV